MRISRVNQRSSSLAAGLVAATIIVASGAANSAEQLQLTSTAFTEGSPVPVEYTCDGKDTSPPLKWTGAPATTKSFALIVDDPDAPMGTWVHWVLFDLPAGAPGLPEAMPTRPDLDGGVRQGKN